MNAIAHTIAGNSARAVPGIDEKIVAHLDKAQKRDVQKDTGHGYRSAREVGNAIGLSPSEARTLLVSLAEAGRVRREDFANGLFWRSINPLPWEPGGAMAVAAAREAELWAQPLTLIVQAGWSDRGHKVWRDVKAYPEGLRDRAEDHVRSENAEAARRRETDRLENRHLQNSYTPPRTYRLVLALKAETSKAEAA